VAILAAFMIDEITDVKIDHFGPFALLDEQFAFERDSFPWGALRVTWELSAAFLALSFFFATSQAMISAGRK